MDLSAFQNQVKMALGQFIVEKQGGKIIIHDKYDFPPPGSWKMYSNLKDFGDYIEASAKDISKAPYFASRFLAERFMAEGDEKNFAIRIELPEEEQVVNIDYDDDIPAGAQNYVFRGAMTNKRKSIWDQFTLTPTQRYQNRLKKRLDKAKDAVKVKPIQRGVEEQEMFSGEGTGRFEYRGVPGDEKGTSQGPNLKEHRRREKKIEV